jgi:two-component system response regulator TtrR
MHELSPYAGLVYIVDDEDTVRDSLAFMLEGYGFDVMAFDSGQGFLDTVDTNKPGCVVLDSRMPGLRGQDVHRLLNEQNSPLGILFLTGHGDLPMAVEAFRQGALDFFQKPVDGELLAKAITKAMTSSVERFKTRTALFKYQALTNREKEVLNLLVSGLKNQQMANKLCVSLRTIEVHRSNLMKKLEVNSVAEMIMQYGQVVEK